MMISNNVCRCQVNTGEIQAVFSRQEHLIVSLTNVEPKIDNVAVFYLV
jgi:hypothetical protein